MKRLSLIIALVSAEFICGSCLADIHQISETYLKENCKSHYSYEGSALNTYIDSVKTLKMPCSPKVLTSLWNRRINTSPDIRQASDTLVIHKETLKRYVQRTIGAWQQSPWCNLVSQSDFLHYILPYRAGEELIDISGDSLLAEAYRPLISGVTDVREAYRIISDTIFKRMREVNSACPYTLDAYTIHYMQQANCEQRCVLLVHLLRSLGIPCAIDNLPFWGNYSRVGHAWVVLIVGNKTYTYQNGKVFESDKHPIDASWFPIKYKPVKEDNYPYPIISEKRPTKVYRREFAPVSMPFDSIMPSLNYSKDVSITYGLKCSIVIPVQDIPSGTVCYLSAFRTGDNWRPIAKSVIFQGKVTFTGLAPGNFYLLYYLNGGKKKSAGNPFLLRDDGTTESYIPQTEEVKAVLRRKYPILSNWTNQWGNMKGGVIEGADNPDFKGADTVAVIERMPFGLTSLMPRKEAAYRYVRYRAPKDSRTPLAKLIFYNADNSLTGTPVSYGVEPGYTNAPFDNNPMTVSATKRPGYWIGLDFGAP